MKKEIEHEIGISKDFDDFKKRLLCRFDVNDKVARLMIKRITGIVHGMMSTKPSPATLEAYGIVICDQLHELGKMLDVWQEEQQESTESPQDGLF